MNISITGTGSYIPLQRVTNTAFETHTFLNDDGSPFKQDNTVIIQKFKSITGIRERRYAQPVHNTSDLAYYAAKEAIASAGIDREELDYIIFAHNFGDVAHGQSQSDMVPSLATRVKHRLGIKKPGCVAYDLLFGCPGWVEGVIQAQAFIKSGMANKCLVIGAETLSRITDASDRDSMIYADGAGASILEKTTQGGTILAHSSASFASEEAYYLFYGKSYDASANGTKYLKMFGRKIYEFAITQVPIAMATCLDKSGVAIADVKKILIHQANQKMDEAIVQRFYELYDKKVPANIMPMVIDYLGNSSVATIPTLLDIILKGNLEDHQLMKGDVIIFASVGAGMNVNAIVYQM